MKKAPPEPGSEPLDNQKHEGFARKIVEGLNGTKAYLAYYPDVEYDTAKVNGSRLLTNINVQERVAFLKRAAASNTVMTLKEWQEWHTMAMRTPIADIDEHSPLAQEMTYEVKGGQRGKLKRGDAPEGNEEASEPVAVVKIKSVCKQASAAQLAKHFGWTAEKVQHSGSVSVEGLGDLLGSICRPGLPHRVEDTKDDAGPSVGSPP